MGRTFFGGITSQQIHQLDNKELMSKRMNEPRGAGALLAGSVALLHALAGCSAEPERSSETGSDISEVQSGLTQTRHPLGAKSESPTLMSAKQMDVSTQALARAAALPTSVDLSAKLPPVGNQLSEGSCVAFAVGYATKTLQEVTEMHWPPHANDHTFSPSWIYNQINNGVDGGSLVSDAMGLVVNNGADTISSFPYVDGQFTTQPDATSMARAAHYKAQSWNTLAVSVTNFKTVLAGGNAVVVAFNVLPDMDSLNGSTNTVYDTDQGTRSLFTTSCSNTAASIAACKADCNASNRCGTCNTTTNVCTVPACTTPPCSRGGHAVAIIGYDDVSQTFRFINSWGAAFNGNGYASFSYGFITNANLGMSAFVMVDKANVPGLQDSTMTWLESSPLLP